MCLLCGTTAIYTSCSAISPLLQHGLLCGRSRHCCTKPNWLLWTRSFHHLIVATKIIVRVLIVVVMVVVVMVVIPVFVTQVGLFGAWQEALVKVDKIHDSHIDCDTQ